MNNEKRKLAFKGFSSDLKCKNVQFRVGETFTTAYISTNKQPTLCSSDGYHYGVTLKDVFDHYPDNKTNRFCVVEILGLYTEDGHKGTTTSLKIVRELSKEEITKQLLEESFDLKTLRDIQEQYPLCHVGGSVGLFLHGVRLKRWADVNSSDLDLIFPYYIAPESTDKLKLDFSSDKASGNDFDYTFSVNGTKVDVKIDPKQRYELITYNGFKYKVGTLLTILEAKMRYALLGNSKHSNDIKEMILGHKESKSTSSNLDDLFSGL
jgi:hypothetical protein